MKLAVRKIFYKAVTPSCDVIELDRDTWMKFLHGDVRTRVSIVCQETGTEHMEGCVREIAWFPMSNQTIFCLKNFSH